MALSHDPEWAKQADEATTRRVLHNGSICKWQRKMHGWLLQHWDGKEWINDRFVQDPVK